jgi:glycosyltransferase involved in cell wall biosynthesis
MHEPFIKQAMDGIMMQKTDFKIEVVVGDDFSTDRTLEIIKSYKNTESIDIKILKREKGDEYWQKRQKLGRLYNFTNILENCTGKYIALLDGDDYWTDPLKLQKQVDFLEENPEYIMCFTNVNDVDEKDNIIKEKKLFYKKDIFEHIDMPFLAPTLTRVMRNKHLNELNWPNVKGGDNFLLTYHSKFGKTKFMNIVTAHYRLHDGGVYSSLIDEEKFLHLINTRLACLVIADYSLKLKLYQKILNYCLHLSSIQSKKYFNIAITETKVSLQAEVENLKKEDIFKIKKVLFLLKIYSFFKFHKFRKYIKKSIMFN